MDLQEMATTLAEVENMHDQALLVGTGTKPARKKMHALAEAQYAPAAEFFAKCLDDLDWEWRYDALRCLGFHYPIAPDDPVMRKIRQLVLTDPYETGLVRMAAASVLGIRSRWPELALRIALEADPNDHVRRSAFRGLLNLAGVPWNIAGFAEKQAEAGVIKPTWHEVARVLAEAGINVDR